MDLALTDEQQQLVEAFDALYTKHAPPELVRAAEATGFDGQLAERLAELGVVPMAVSEDRGGWGASFFDLALVAERQGRHVAPVPVIEQQIAARLLARLPGDDAATTLQRALDGEQLVTIGVRPVVSGTASPTVAGLVPAAAVADAAVLLLDDRLVLVPLEGRRTPVENLGALPLADVEISGDGIVELARGAEALALHDEAVDEWLALTAAALVGVGVRALEIGVEYVTERQAWGVPIGSFQAVSHPLADSATALDGAQLLAYEAAWARDEQLPRAAELAAMAFAFAYESARDVTYRSLHFHGGYGFMMEYDIQLYFRRARAWANVFAEPELVYRRVADRRYGAVPA